MYFVYQAAFGRLACRAKYLHWWGAVVFFVLFLGEQCSATRVSVLNTGLHASSIGKHADMPCCTHERHVGLLSLNSTCKFKGVECISLLASSKYLGTDGAAGPGVCRRARVRKPQRRGWISRRTWAGAIWQADSRACACKRSVPDAVYYLKCRAARWFFMNSHSQAARQLSVNALQMPYDCEHAATCAYAHARLRGFTIEAL